MGMQNKKSKKIRMPLQLSWKICKLYPAEDKRSRNMKKYN